MNHLISRLMRPIYAASLLLSLALWLILTTWGALSQQHQEHATLSAAAAALGNELGNADEHDIIPRLAHLHDTLQHWEITAAAYDQHGVFVTGNKDLRSDGMQSGHEPAPPSGRQISVVPLRDGYVLLARSPQALVDFRFVTAIQLLISLLIAILVAWLVGWPWARSAAQILQHARDDFQAIADGQNRAPQLPQSPITQDMFIAANAALTRLSNTLLERTSSEENLRTFIGDAGHELRTPLAIAVGYLGILKRGGLQDAQLAERIINDIGIEHERLTSLVERILYLARLDTLSGDSDAVSDVVKIIHEAIALVRPLDLERTIVLTIQSHPLAKIQSDDLRDAIRNILENALRYAPGAHIEIHVNEVGADVSLAIHDSGPGLDAFTVAHAFDRFFRGAVQREINGTGLGLSIVRRIIERASGQVTLQSALGEGTSIEIRLPRAGAQIH